MDLKILQRDPVHLVMGPCTEIRHRGRREQGRPTGVDMLLSLSYLWENNSVLTQLNPKY